MNLKTNTRTFGKKKNTHPDKRARVENDKFCVFVTVFVAVYLFVCFVFLLFTSDSIIQFEKKSLETILLFCLGQHHRHSTFNFPSITDVSITGAGRAHPFEDSFRKLWREFDKRSGLGCSKAGQRYPPNKSLSSGSRNWFPQYLSAG